MVFHDVDYLKRLKLYLDTLDINKIEILIKELLEIEKRESRVFTIGNGGSASTASHMATDLSSLNSGFNFKLGISSLVDNSSLITAISNDDDFKNIFSSQLSRLGKSGDLVILFSASGNSPNLISAIKTANIIGMKSFGILGFNGGKIKNLVTDYLLVETKLGDYGPVEDIHLVVNHMIKEEIIIRINLDSYRSGGA